MRAPRRHVTARSSAWLIPPQHQEAQLATKTHATSGLAREGWRHEGGVRPSCSQPSGGAPTSPPSLCHERGPGWASKLADGVQGYCEHSNDPASRLRSSFSFQDLPTRRPRVPFDNTANSNRTIYRLTAFSVALTRTEGVVSRVAAKLNIVRSDGLFSPRSSCPMYVR